VEEFKSLITIVTYGVEGFGVVIIVVGCLVATVRFLLRWRAGPPEATYHEYRRVVGRSIILGLEFLIAGDVIRTVIVSHTLSSVAVLALVVVIRAFLSFTLAMEIEGRLPWQPSAPREG
jgi:uncharacterized membrane protein